MFKKYFIVAISAIVGLCFAIGGSLFSQVNAQQPPRIPTVSTNQANAIDIAFVNEAAQAGLGNIMLGQLALQKSTNPSVQKYANAEIAEQQGVKQQLTQVAPTIGITLPTTPAPKFQAAMDRLSKLSGAQFDNAYLDEGGVNAHLENAALFQREAAFGQNPNLLTLVNQGLPVINQHFTIASSLTNYRFAQVPRRYNEASVPTAPRAQ